ncbi:hypothetical protein FRC06_007133 [Ceratobasidium sp. 370]|nr:hypothetical protein FRC06_007133 [Ceratobasidium sp. 370]
MDKTKRAGPEPPPFRRRSSQLASVTAPPMSARPTKRPKMSLENAKKELISHKLVRANTSFSLNTLLEILFAFTGNEVTEDGLGEPWEIVMATAVILEEEAAVETEREKLEIKEEMLKVSEERLTEERASLTRERLEAEERKKNGASLEATLEKMKGMLEDFEKERKALEELRKGTSEATPTGQTQSDRRGPPPFFVKETPTRRGEGDNPGAALSERTLKENEERMKRGEEKRERQLMLDGATVAGQSGLKGQNEKELLEKARKALEVINEVENNRGVLYELNSKEAREKFPVLVERVPIEADINKKETIEKFEEDNGLEKGGIISAKWRPSQECSGEPRSTMPHVLDAPGDRDHSGDIASPERGSILPTDNRYRYYVTSEEWTWELLSTAALDWCFRVPNVNRAPPPPPATGTNTTPLGQDRLHPRPENLAQPTPRGAAIAPRQSQLTSWLNNPLQPNEPQPSQSPASQDTQSPVVPKTPVNV